MLKIFDNNYQCVGILNLEGNLDKITPYFEDKYYQNLLTGAETFEFTTLGYSKQAKHLNIGNYIAFNDHEGITRLFSIINVEDSHGEEYLKTVYCETCGLELLNDIIRPITISGKDCYLFLQSILQDTEWEVGNVSSELWQPMDFEITDYKTVYDAIQDYVIEKYGGEVSFRVVFKNNKLVGKYVDVYKERNAEFEILFSYDKNITNVKRTVDSSNLVTALIGIGNNNITFKEIKADDKPLDQDFIANELALQKWGVKGQHLMGVFKADTSDPKTLLDLTREELKKNSEPQITYEVNTELLGEIPRIGARIGVSDHDLGLYLTARVSELTTSKTDPDSNECKFANFKEVRNKNTDFSYESIMQELKDYLAKLETGTLTQVTLDNIRKYLIELNMTKEEIDKIFEELKLPDKIEDSNNNIGDSNNNTGTEVAEYYIVNYVTNVRSSAGLSGTTIGKAQIGDRYKIYERGIFKDDYEWLKIKFNGQDAYCAVVDGNIIRKEQTVINQNSYYDGLWIGDSITVGMQNYGVIHNSIGVCAVGGKSASYFLKNFNLVTAAKTDPKYISLLLGVNAPTDITNMKKFLEKLIETYPSRNIYVNAVLPVGELFKSSYYASSQDFNKKISNFNAQMKEYCQTSKYLHYVTTSLDGMTSNGYLKTSVSTSDYIHLNKTGSQTLYDNIIRGITSTYTNTGGTRAYWEDGKVSATVFRFLKGMEGFSRYPYTDSAGYWTIAYGITEIGEKQVYDELKAQVPLDEEVGAKASYDLMNKNYGKKILNAFKNLGCNNQNQFDALVSLAYNGGIGSVTGDNSLTRAIKANPNDEQTIRTAWEKFKITAGGQVLAGLKTRRKNECNMYFGQPVEMRPIVTVNANGSWGPAIKENNGNGWLPPEVGGVNENVNAGDNDILTTLQGEKQNITIKDGEVYNCKTLTSLQFALYANVQTSFASKLIFSTPKNTSPMYFKQSNYIWMTGDDCVNGALLPVADTKYEVIIKYNSNNTIPKKYIGSVIATHGTGTYSPHTIYSGADKVLGCAIEYYNNRTKFKYNTTTPISTFSSGTPASNRTKWFTGGLNHIDNATFINQIFKGRGYNNSIYKNTSYGIGLSSTLTSGIDLGRYAADQAQTCVMNGWHLSEIKNQDNWNLLRKGDLVFFKSRALDGSRYETVASRFMQVGHVAIVAKTETTSEGQTNVYVYDASSPTGTILYRQLKNNYPEDILFFARVRK